MIPVYPPLNVMLFKFLFIHKTFFARVCFLMLYLTWWNFASEKWQNEVAKTLLGFIILFWNLDFSAKVAKRA